MSTRTKLLMLTHAYVSRHITIAKRQTNRRMKTFGSFHNSPYQMLVASLDDPNTSNGTYCYYCRELINIGETMLSSPSNSLAKAYHETCGRKVNVYSS